ncbi:hypothetical protein MTR_4g070250 [Medicago truncatula]|uniref:Uncharacterized protein n=1 Tax=Medicago truncatula TaxID=3880 RepID=G7JHB2_MEDTR|nr:hypothetical protein MTR_4g070250 [Medicago truncatula]
MRDSNFLTRSPNLRTCKLNTNSFRALGINMFRQFSRKNKPKMCTDLFYHIPTLELGIRNSKQMVQHLTVHRAHVPSYRKPRLTNINME